MEVTGKGGFSIVSPAAYIIIRGFKFTHAASRAVMVTEGYTTVDPRLGKDGAGVFRLQAGSPAVDAASGSYPAGTVDMDGQLRTGVLDKGADEMSRGRVVAHILSAGEVGCGAGR